MATGHRFDNPRLFRTQAGFRSWLEKNHDRVTELWVGFWNKASGRKGMTYPEAVDEALCWGWIDGIKKKVDSERYTNRFTPRRARSKWSEVNLRRYAELEVAGRVAPPGAQAYARFDPAKHQGYSFEDRPDALPQELEAEFRKDIQSWTFFQAQAPGYRRAAIHWVASAKREETRLRRLGQLVEASTSGEHLPQIAGRPARRKQG